MKKAKSYIWISFTAIICFEFLISPAMAATDLIDVMALEDLYRTLGYPPQLIGWRLDGGDPCLESWTGISCNGTSVRLINLAGLDLGGTLGWQLNLPNLWQLDLSFNHIQGAIPGSLPINITYIDLSSNKFSMNIPYSLASMKHLSHLNLSHNSLSGPISNLFADLHSLKQMDLSDNNFIGDLPSSFGNLTNLTALYLQNNHFTGSVVFLENLQLTDLNIQNNNFSGLLPKQFQRVPNLWIWGNSFQFGADFPPWDFPQNNIPTDQNINSPPTNELNAIESYPRFGDGRNRQRRFSPVGIAFGVVGIAVMSAILGMVGYLAFASRPHAAVPAPEDRAVSINYWLCDGLNSGEFSINLSRFRTYREFGTMAAELVYGPFLGRAVSMELLPSPHFQVQQHERLFQIGMFGLQMTWKRHGEAFQALTAETNWEQVKEEGNVFEVRCTGPNTKIMVMPWRSLSLWVPYSIPDFTKIQTRS